MTCFMSMTRLAKSGALVLALLGAACAEPPPISTPDREVCVKTLTEDVDVPTEQAADILIVVDNSGSMAEEQGNLAQNFLNQNPAQCPLQDLANIPEEFKNPKREAYTGNGALAQCGFIQIVAAFENDFRVGVITTDVGLCDNRLPVDGDTRGFRPQRGCLQPDGNGARVIARADLLDADASNDDLATRFRTTLEGISTFGSPFERGLDAMSIFLDPEGDKHPDCADHLAQFRRDEASLVVVFLTDEEDCSHGLGTGVLEGFGNENEGEVCGEFADHFLSVDSKDCYAREDALSPVDLYLAALQRHDDNAKVAVIAGAIDDIDGNAVPAGCLVGADGLPEGGEDVCFESGGLSNFTGAGDQPCGPDTADARGGLPCCVADAGDRYFDFAALSGNEATDSICNQSFRQTMLQLAAFIAAVDVVQLAEPTSPGGVLVEVTRAETGEVLLLQELRADADCALETGFKVEGDQVVLCGEARPGPGDQLAVRARGQEGEVCRGPRLEISGGGVNCAGAGVAWPIALVVLALAARRRR
jgi:uncharacterized protein (TIGR03382 family)